MGPTGRSRDVLDWLGNMTECVFCDRISKGEYNWEDYNCVAFTPLNPVTFGHTLIVPKRHVPHFVWDMATSADAMRAACYLADCGMYGRDFNLITSKGPAATQTIEHLHLHLVPRFEGDGLHLPWTGQK